MECPALLIIYLKRAWFMSKIQFGLSLDLKREARLEQIISWDLDSTTSETIVSLKLVIQYLIS